MYSCNNVFAPVWFCLSVWFFFLFFLSFSGAFVSSCLPSFCLVWRACSLFLCVGAVFLFFCSFRFHKCVSALAAASSIPFRFFCALSSCGAFGWLVCLDSTAVAPGSWSHDVLIGLAFVLCLLFLTDPSCVRHDDAFAPQRNPFPPQFDKRHRLRMGRYMCGRFHSRLHCSHRR